MRDEHVAVFTVVKTTKQNKSLVKNKSTYASWNISSRITDVIGVDSACLSIIELPETMGGMTVLKGSQIGKFHGIITKINKGEIIHFKLT
jgi:hypothetical protein